MKNHTISCIIKNKRGECLTDNGWNKDFSGAILFSPQQAQAALNNLLKKSPSDGLVLAYVIQDKNFNYFDGESQWVYNIGHAKFYTAEEAEAALKAFLL